MNTALALLLILPSADVRTTDALAQLSARRFQQREAGQRYLASQMPRVRQLLLWHTETSPCQEARRRCRAILASYRPATLERLRW